MANLTVNTKKYGQITLNTKPHSDPLKRFRIITMILISSDTTYNLLKRTLAITIFFKGNLAGASSFSNF